MANGTTNIFDLPSEGNNQPVFNINDNLSGKDTKLSPSGVTLDQTTINQIVSGIQQASLSGATQLQSRDIPINKTQFIDEQVQPEYIPQTNTKNFIEEEEETDTSNSYLNKTTNYFNIFDGNSNEVQILIILSMLFFILQLPFVKTIVHQYIPSMFFKDGNPNIYYNIFLSILFGISYYILTIFINTREKEVLYE